VDCGGDTWRLAVGCADASDDVSVWTGRVKGYAALLIRAVDLDRTADAACRRRRRRPDSGGGGGGLAGEEPSWPPGHQNAREKHQKEEGSARIFTTGLKGWERRRRRRSGRRGGGGGGAPVVARWRSGGAPGSGAGWR
jgi:hypothetical protein